MKKSSFIKMLYYILKILFPSSTPSRRKKYLTNANSLLRNGTDQQTSVSSKNYKKNSNFLSLVRNKWFMLGEIFLS